MTRTTEQTRAKKSWPYTIKVDGMTYYQTGRTGINIESGKPAVEYEAEDASRVWVVGTGRTRAIVRD